MKKLIYFLVKRRTIIFIVTLVLAAVCGILMPFVRINEDMTLYLPKDSGMKEGLSIIEKQFPEATVPQTLRIMFENLSEPQKSAMAERLLAIEGIESVDYDQESEAYNKGNYALFVATTAYAEIEKNQALGKEVESAFSDYEITVYYANADESVLDWMIPIAVVLAVVILLLMSRSFFEPVLILFTIAIAVVMNMGSNIILPSVSDLTFSVAAVLQLVLSIDYAVIVIHRYLQEKSAMAEKDNVQAMTNALTHSFGSVTSSSVTTFVGLLALLFMSFTIGADMGLVLAKGVLLSLICTFTVLPAIVLWSDKLLTKTEKRKWKIKEDETNA